MARLDSFCTLFAQFRAFDEMDIDFEQKGREIPLDSFCTLFAHLLRADGRPPAFDEMDIDFEQRGREIPGDSLQELMADVKHKQTRC